MSNHSVTRRAALGAAAVGVAALEATQAMAQASERKTFVLVHGAWHGGWCWRRVADILEKRGHKVYAQSLTGNGDRPCSCCASDRSWPGVPTTWSTPCLRTAEPFAMRQ